MPVLKIKENGVWVPVSGMSGHTHTKDDITDLQSSLDELLQSSKDYTDSVLDSKVESNHGTNVSYSTDAPVMDGIANAGSASTVARSDHRHPTDTSRASKTELDALSELVGDEAVSEQIEDAIANKSDIGHNHDDRYYTESEVDALIKEVDWFGIGTSIPSNSDLNTYNTPGKYYVGSTSVSKTILNSPITDDNFALFVFARTSSNSTSLTQMIISLGSNLYIRGNSSNGEWRDWNKYAKASEVIKNLSVSGQTITYTKGDGTTGTITTQDTDTIYTHPAYTAKNSGLYKVTVDATGHISATANVAKSDITALGIPAQDTTYSIATTSVDGLMSKSDKSKLDTISSLVGDTAVSSQIEDAFDGAITGLSVSGKTITYTKGDGSTGTITTQDTDTVYTHPTYTSKSAGLYKVTVDGTGHVSATTAVAKSDITALGIPAQDTTYSAATTSAAGLMSAADKTKLDGIATGATKITVDSALSSTSTNPVQNKVVNAAISNLNTLVGDTAVSEQISTAIANKSDVDHTHSAYINQNAFSKVLVGSTTIEADSTTDTLTLVAGSNVTLTPDASGDKVTIAAKDTVYTHPSSGATAGTYKSVTVNAQGHVTGGSNPTTLNGYGITDAATKTEFNTLSGLVGDKAVSEQINDAIGNIKGLPGVTTSDNGKFLRVVSGTWQAVAISSAEGSSF